MNETMRERAQIVILKSHIAANRLKLELQKAEATMEELEAIRRQKHRMYCGNCPSCEKAKREEADEAAIRS